MSKLFSCHYKRYGEMSLRSTGKMMDFDYLEEYLKGVNLWKAVTSLSEHFSLFAVV